MNFSGSIPVVYLPSYVIFGMAGENVDFVPLSLNSLQSLGFWGIPL